MFLFLLTAGLPRAALARDAAFSIPPTTLDIALTALAREAGVEITSTEAGLRSVRTGPILGRMPVRKALDRLLADTGYRAIAMAGGYRVVRAPVRAAPRKAKPAAPPPPAPREPDIVVTASKQRVSMLRYPGSLMVIEGQQSPPATAGTITDLAPGTPVLQSTQLGAGRNKVFIRGIADSSFSGTTQSPTSIYLDDVQLTYSGPDPGLRLYDMRRIEILEGAQGTLYGSGAIGGVIRLTSNPVDLSAAASAVSGGVTATQGASTGFDVAGMVNLPVLKDRLGIRAVAYNVHEGGYLDDVGRGLRNVNQGDTFGGRLALRLDAADGWQVEASGAGQWIDTRDGQYAETAEGPLTRRSRIAQSFDNRLLFGRVTVTKDWDSGLRFFSATGIVGYRSTDQFDATPRRLPGSTSPPVIYTANRDKWLLSQEARVSRSLPNGNSWVAGFSLVRDQDILSRAVGSPGNAFEIIGVTNVTKAASLFGEATLALLPGLSVTAGGRATAARTDGDPSAAPRSAKFVKGRLSRRLDPTLAFSWQVAPHLALFTRFQTGYRTGGLAVAAGVGRVADYRSDAITVSEIGIRKLRDGPTGLAFSGSVSIAHWSNIQADLINRRGQPYTDNIGDARIEAAEGTVDWAPIVGLHAEASFLFTDNEVSGPIADLSTDNNRRLPETPPFAGHWGLSYEWTTPGVAPRIGFNADYVGRSVLGTGDLLDVSQGNYWLLGLSAGVRRGRLRIDLAVDNLTNSKANRFAYGNPFSLTYRDQTTPLRPRHARLGIGLGW
ncbi:TonB-dependent receptor domain-containing protein [Sphingomonas asaccharolytica]|uniref:TonB-dependent receptor domain-containing protein n=1 Tax=Sphingomonas asaccharolytica TaxID=40681 RepID=UPI000831D488|nr:TonB-dependent receptor [Sphingomonas asaccharolytica]